VASFRRGMKEEVKKVIEEIKPSLQVDGGDIELIDVSDEGVVKVRLTGACGSCPMSLYTLKVGVEQRLKDKVKGITSVEQII